LRIEGIFILRIPFDEEKIFKDRSYENAVAKEIGNQRKHQNKRLRKAANIRKPICQLFDLTNVEEDNVVDAYVKFEVGVAWRSD